jgi:hypothetical protein
VDNNQNSNVDIMIDNKGDDEKQTNFTRNQTIQMEMEDDTWLSSNETPTNHKCSEKKIATINP